MNRQPFPVNVLINLTLILLLLLLTCSELQAQGRRGSRGQRGGSTSQNATPNTAPTGDGQTDLTPGPAPNLVDSADENRPLEVVNPGDLQPLAPIVPAKVVKYASFIFDKYDTNRDGVLQREEWEKMPGSPQSMDISGDLAITLEEFVRYIALFGRDRTIHRPNPPIQTLQQNFDWSQYSTFQPLGSATPLKREEESQATDKKEGERVGEGAEVPEGQVGESQVGESNEEGEEVREISDDELDNLSYEQIISGKYKPSERKYYRPLSELRGVPNWFIAKDRNGDGQLSIIEYDPGLTPKGLREFGVLDKNGDGFITIEEVMQRQ
ncbi:MAG: hypothetical protein ACRC10_02350 [Thermoguttaceae bacterium]